MRKNSSGTRITATERQMLISELAAKAHAPREYVERLVGNCRLCNQRPTAAIGIFIPEDPRLWSSRPVRPGALRTYPYGLCKTCLDSDTPERVAQRVREHYAVLLRSLEAMGAVHCLPKTAGGDGSISTAS